MGKHIAFKGSMAYDFKSMVLKDFAKAKQQYMKPVKGVPGAFCNDFLSYTATMEKSGMKTTSPTQSTNAPKSKNPISEDTATVVVYTKWARQISLDSNPNKKMDFTNETNVKLKTGDKIKVRIVRNNNGKIIKTEFVTKLNN